MPVAVLHSGGLDSTVCLLLALRDGKQPVSIGVEYDQSHVVELHYAGEQCKRLGVERRVISVRWNKPTRNIPLDRSPEEMRSGVSPAFLPARNLVFLALAAAEAAAMTASEIWIGVNSVDFSGYPDCRSEFIAAFDAVLDAAVPGGPRVVAPLQNMRKAEIALMAQQYGLRPGDTWSCYRPQGDPAQPFPCGRCDACILHAEAWQEVVDQAPDAAERSK